MFTNEYPAFSQEYYEKAILNHKDDGEFKSKITVNGENIDLDYVIKDGDYVLHRTWRNETPIYAQMPTLLKETDNYVIVSKPHSMPEHPIANYKFNTLQMIVENAMGQNHYKNLQKIVHKVDSQSCEIVFFAKNTQSCNNYTK